MKLFWQCLAAVLAGIAIAGALAVLFRPAARAATNAETVFECTALVEGIAFFADLRDMGANVERVVRTARERKPGDMPAARFAVIEREIRRLWAERLPADESQFALYKRCKAQLGDMGRET